MKTFIFAILLCLCNPTLGQTQNRDNNWLVFEGTVIKVGKSPGIVCGVTAPYRIAKYKVEKIYQGQYNKGSNTGVRPAIFSHLI